MLVPLVSQVSALAVRQQPGLVPVDLVSRQGGGNGGGKGGGNNGNNNAGAVSGNILTICVSVADSSVEQQQCW